MNQAIKNRGWATDYLLYALLPLLAGIFPAIFHYANNSDIALFSTLVKLLLLFAGIAIALYVLFAALTRRPALSAVGATVLLFFFHTYGLAANALRTWDILRVEHYTLLPVILLVAFELVWLLGRLTDKALKEAWRTGVLILSALLAFNIAKIGLVEIRTGAAAKSPPEVIAEPNPSAKSEYPDIYYFVYDEMAGFEVMRQYWKYDEVGALADFLKSKGFYVAEQSHGTYPETLYELAQRLNYEPLPKYQPNQKGHYHEDAANARAFAYLKSLGYTTVGFDENRSPFGFPAGPPMALDVLYESAPGNTPTQGVGLWDGFSLLVIDNTMLQPLAAGVKLSSPVADAERHRDMISFTMNKMSRLQDVPAPRFVYVHLLLPHVPHMFKPDGSLGPPSGYYDWNNYLDNYKFTIPVIENSVKDILASADPARPPVIIIQSDHGARNTDFGLGILPDYPDKYKTLIVNAMLLPGCDQSVLTQDMNPINTLPIVFNCYFGAEMPLLPPNTPQ